MSHPHDSAPTPSRDLGNGLTLRRSTAADAPALVTFLGDVFRNQATQQLDQTLVDWVRDLLRGDHPTFDMTDFTLVEDRRAGTIVSALCLIGQTWSYGGIAIPVGRPELVGTHPEYRRRGLVRAQMAAIHDWSRARGELMQAITGIPWYYRQFGYEMALELNGGRTGYLPQVPRLSEGEADPYRVRAASAADLSFIAEVVRRGAERWLVAGVRDEALWRYELHGRTPGSIPHRELHVVESAAGEPVGCLAHPPQLWGPALVIDAYELKEGVSWAAVTPSVLRYVAATGERYAAARQKEPFSWFSFGLGTAHPVYDVLAGRLPQRYPPYAWYIRVPDLPAFVRRIAPVLERRLVASPLAGHSGELRLSFYRSGLRLALEQGRLAAIEPWEPSIGSSARFPELTFLQLLFGYRSLAELRYAFPDCLADDDSAVLLTTLFPKLPSFVWGIG